jgi:hypothetical protein
MNFLYPSFLWGLGIIAIPIIIHLFNFRKAKRVYFSNVQFLTSVQQSNKSKLQLKHILALLARILALVFLVLAFAQPYLIGDKSSNAANEVYLYLDNSQSMLTTSVGNSTGFDEAYSIASQVLTTLPKETKYKLLTNDFAPFSNTLKSSAEVQELLTELKTSSTSRTFNEIQQKLVSDENLNEKAEVLIISDFQKSTMALDDSKLAIDSVRKYSIVPIYTEDVANIFIDSVFLEKPYLFSKEVNKLNVTLYNSGREDVFGMVIKLYIDENQVASAGVDIPKNSRITTTFDLAYDLKKINKCRISIDDYPVTFDNDYFFTLNLARAAKVTEIRNSSSSKVFEAVYGNPQLFNYHAYDVGSIDYSAINRSDLIIVNEVVTINNTMLSLLNTFLRSGGSVVVVPHLQSDSTTLSRLANLPISKNANAGRSTLNQINNQNPFFDGIFDAKNSKYEMPEASKIFSWPTRGDNIISFKNGQPFLTQFTSNQGRLMYFSCAFQSDRSSFQRHAIFVPVMYKIAMSSMRTNLPLSYTTSSGVITIPLDSAIATSVYFLKNDDKEIYPDQRVINNQLILTLPKGEISAGFYDLMTRNNTVSSFALNLDKRESLMDRYPTYELRKMFYGHKNVTVSDDVSAAEFGSALKQQYEGTDLWKYALILVLLFLLCEVLILRFL